MDVFTSVRWGTTILLSLGWLGIAAFNAWVTWKTRRSEESHTPSPVGLVGGMLALMAWQVCPWEPRRTWPLVVLALVLDVGSLPALGMVLVRTGIDALGRDRHERERRWGWATWWLARWSWIDVVTRGIIGWFLLTFPLLVLVPPGGRAVHLAALIASLAYWAAYTVLVMRVKRRRRAGRPRGG